MARALISEPCSGITTVHGALRLAAANATAAPWLPDECVMTPRAHSSSLSEKTAFVAPRALKAPIFCRFSHLKKIDAPSSRSSVAEVMTGVRWTWPARRSAAASTSENVATAPVGSIIPEGS